jgi:hypothetical protein
LIGKTLFNLTLPTTGLIDHAKRAAPSPCWREMYSLLKLLFFAS